MLSLSSLTSENSNIHLLGRSSSRFVRESPLHISMATRSLRHGAKDVPQFDGTELLELPRYLKDIELIAEECSLNSAGKVRYAKYYTMSSVAEL